jgi:multiple sugar transport system substrate-binding protein
VTLEVWSHEADEPAKVAFRELAARNFEKSHPGAKVKITWYEKNPLFAALKTALPAGKGPDVFYLEPDQTEYITANYIVPLDDSVNWNQIEPWARKVWTHNGKTYGIPQEAYTVELYYNKDMLKTLGVTLPANAQFTQAQFLDLVKKARAAGMTPIAQGVGDRPYPGAYITVEALLRKLGPDDIRNCSRASCPSPIRASSRSEMGEGARGRRRLSEEFHDAQARRVALLLLQQARSVDVADGSFYTGRAFVPEDKGGQPQTFPLGIMQFPAMDRGACNECKTSTIGASFAINAASKQKQLAAEFLNAMSTPEMGKMWIETVYLQTGIKADVKNFTGPHAAYFTELMERQEGEKYFIGQPRDMVTGACKDSFAQVLNSGFPGGLISVDQTVEADEQGLLQGLTQHAAGPYRARRRCGPRETASHRSHR